jgi:hypothetical protein
MQVIAMILAPYRYLNFVAEFLFLLFGCLDTSATQCVATPSQGDALLSSTTSNSIMVLANGLFSNATSEAERVSASLALAAYSWPFSLNASGFASLLTPRKPPSLALAAGSNPIVFVPQGVAYLHCKVNQRPTPGLPCELGAVAADPVDGPGIQDRVLMCPAPGCMSNDCVGERVIDKQPMACGVDTMHAVGAA